MPRPSKGARLYLKRFKTGPAWIIRDGSIERGTGCGAGERAGAERALGEYIAKKHRPDYSDGNPANVKIGDVLVSYGNECSDPCAVYALPKLIEHFVGKTLANITPKECQGYVAWRTSQPIAAAKHKATAKRVATGTARRELETLSAAVGHAYREGRINYRVAVWLPDKPPARDRYLSKSELARLLWAAWRNPRAKHLVRFILIGLYSSTRHEAILRLQWMPNLQGGWVDLEQRLIHRKGVRQSETNKRRPPVGISRRLGAHLERWRRAPQGQHVVEYDGQPIRSIRRAFKTARIAAGLGPDVVPHTLRHTFASWAVQRGASFTEVAEALGTTEAMVRRVYGHLHPEYTRATVELVSGSVSGSRKIGHAAK